MSAAEERFSAPSRVHRRPRLQVWREQHAWCCRASLRALFARPFGSALTVLVLGFALALPLAFYLLLTNVQRLGGAVGQSQSISVFLKDSAHAQAAQSLATELRARPGVAQVTIKTPAQGLAELGAVQGFGEALHALPDNPLPYALLVQPQNGLARVQVEGLVSDLRASPVVGLVQDNGAWRARLDALIALGRRVTALLAGLLAVAALGAVGNTVRLDIRSRADEIAVQRLVGAGSAFVRRPYLYEGVWYGLAAGAIAVLLLLALEAGVAAPVRALAESYGERVTFGGLPVAVLILVPLIAALLGWLGAFLASTRYLFRTESR